MGIRFRRSMKILPGVRLTVGKSSVGISAGVRGARVSLNSSGRVTTSAGIPGSGLYWTESKSLRKKKPKSTAPRTVSSSRVEETIVDGRPLDVIKGSFHRVSVWFDQSCNFEVVADRCITRLLEKRNENDPDLEEIT